MMVERDDKPSAVGIEPIRALDPSYYTDPRAFERDKQRILFRTWQYAGHASPIWRRSANCSSASA